ncbi:hypothetical protein AB0K14_17325 [Actinosynnema sp. NPDC050801]|uniref:hypothetical protein n=1 Tax=unclassified Actinosynnema TaxID=2637065 RepID=UPI0033FDC0B6
MSGDFSEQDRRGLAEWLDDCAGRHDAPAGPDVPDQRGGPAYVVSFGWLPSRLPPAAPSIPAPRRALDDLPGWGERQGRDERR